MYFQREIGRVLPELEHTIWYDEDGEDNDDLIDTVDYI